MKTYYLINIIFNKTHYYCAWFDNDQTGLLTTEENKLLQFPSADKLRRYLEEQRFNISPHPIEVFDFDEIRQWADNPAAQTIDGEKFLNAWNMFTDISTSLNAIFENDQKRNKKVYEKLFWGTNPPSMTPEGEKYMPNWTKKECKQLAAVLHRGIELFSTNIASS